MLPDDEARPAVPSDRVLRLGSFTTMPAFIDLAMMQLFSGWHPTTFTFGLCAASTLAMPTVRRENAMLVASLRFSNSCYRRPSQHCGQGTLIITRDQSSSADWDKYGVQFMRRQL